MYLGRKICHNRLYSVYQVKQSRIEPECIFFKAEQGQVTMSLNEHEVSGKDRKCPLYLQP